ncbi:DUF819 domain-containing protein [Seongchinamella unica]|uniref:DUF819 domain-containing protein n=1 Tax=Seongchinamella unica TaxID=2547392 RepID=A0A4R5LVA8_9GAMM|nr:DUF819 family protein [Seongchinamella unica]TDG15374.1 DUF819 domain-containing protein [Seongchinamella unica]
MISSVAGYLASLALLAGVLVWLARRYPQWPLFRWLPPIVLTYLCAMLLAASGIWAINDAQTRAYAEIKRLLVPAMILLLLLQCRLGQLLRLGPRLLAAFALAAGGIMLGCVVAFVLFRSALGEGAWGVFATLAGSWLGGTANMVAVQAALEVPEADLGYALLVDSIDYSLWLMLLLALVPFAPRFNAWARARSLLPPPADDATLAQSTAGESQLLLLAGVGLLGAVVSDQLGQWLGGQGFFTVSVVRILAVTAIGLALAYTPLARLSGSDNLASALLYLMVATIASRTSFADLASAPLYLVAGLVILLVHGAIMLVAARLLRLDLFTCGVASLANIGGVASAPILAAAYSRQLVPVGVLMALLGYVVGTAGGLLVGRVLMGLGGVET